MKRLPLVLLTAAALLFAFAGTAHAQEKKKIVLLAGKPSHGWGGHEHNAGCRLLAKALNESGLPVEAVVYENGWPKDADKALAGAAAVLIYCDGGDGHMALPHLKELDALSDKGVGIGCLHYGVEPGGGTKQPDGRAEFLKWIGGYFETFYSINPTWQATFTEFPKHPVANGVRPFSTHDEWYYHMRFRDNMEGVTPILTAVPPDKTRGPGATKEDAHGTNKWVRADIGKGVKEHVMWVSENKNGSRGFGCTGAHYFQNFWQDDFRKVLLNAIVWIAKVEVPADGVKSERPAAEVYLHQDEKVPANFDLEKFKKEVEAMNKPVANPAAAAK